jgi:hypothetical protein
MVNGYRRVSIFNHEIEVPNVPLREEVELHFTPNLAKQVIPIAYRSFVKGHEAGAGTWFGYYGGGMKKVWFDK